MRYLGVWLGLALVGLASCKTDGDAKKQESERTGFSKCNKNTAAQVVTVDLANVTFHPSNCLAKGGTVIFVDDCPAGTPDIKFTVSGPDGGNINVPELGLRQPTTSLRLSKTGGYTIQSSECIIHGHTPKTGTLEVSTDMELE